MRVLRGANGYDIPKTELLRLENSFILEFFQILICEFHTLFFGSVRKRYWFYWSRTVEIFMEVDLKLL